MSERRGTKALEVWCKRVTEGYPGVKVENMTTSWRDGLAFCAMIHHFRPDLIDFNSLDKRDVYRNNDLAFTIAERHLGIPALLDAEDMVEYEVPDRLSMLTYLSQFYQTFVGQQGNSPNSRTPTKRSSVSPSLSSSPDLSPSMSPTSSSPPTKVQAGGAGATTGSGSTARSPRILRDPCTHCGLPVFLAERLIVGIKRALYHRTCFRCARCSAQLTLANCYETEDERFCCETCPDEENDRSDSSSFGTDRLDSTNSKCESVCSFDEPSSALHRSSCSDDEKSIGIIKAEDMADEYSASFESALDNELESIKKATSQPDRSAPLASTQHVTDDLDSKSDTPSLKLSPTFLVNNDNGKHDVSKDCAQSSQKDELSLSQATKESTISLTTDLPLCENERIHGGIKPLRSPSDCITLVSQTNSNVSRYSESTSISKHQHVTASTESGADNSTKDSQFSSADHKISSIVKMRKMMFESEDHKAKSKGVSIPKKASDNLGKGGEAKKVKVPDLDPAKIEGSNASDLYINNENFKVDVQGEFIHSTVVKERMQININDKDVEDNDSIFEANDETNSEQEIRNPNLSVEYEAKEKKHLFRNDGNVDDHSELKEITISSVEEQVSVKPTVSPRKIFHAPASLKPTQEESLSHLVDYPSELNPFGEEDEDAKGSMDTTSSACEKLSTNPFGSSDDEENEPVVLRRKEVKRPPRPPPPQPSLVTSNKSGSRATEQTASNLNPFWSDGEEPAEQVTSTPIPRPRTIWLTPEPSPRTNKSASVSSKIMSSSEQFGSTSSLTSMNSDASINRRSKKPAPAPPLVSLHQKSDSVPSSPYSSLNRSPHRRKSRPAPQPPSSNFSESKQSAITDESWDKLKIQKDEANRNKQAIGKDDVSIPRDKSTYGQWKRKKGPAPPRPVPQRRQVRAMPLKELKRELEDIEVKQQELERQGVKLEQTIRLKFEETPVLLESSMTPDVEVLVLQLFELVNEKNELFRKQAELMYLRRQQRLEEEHAELEYQIRCLMAQPERNKTDSDKAREEELIQTLVEVVERRNQIIDCLEMDRLREAEEDISIHAKLGQFAATGATPVKHKKEKKKKKDKDSKKKRDLKLDADKDIDEIEAAAVAAAKEKKTKKKWF